MLDVILWTITITGFQAAILFTMLLPFGVCISVLLDQHKQ